MSILHWAVLTPFLFSFVVPPLYKFFRKVHTGWFVLIVPLILFIYFLSFVPLIANGNTIIESVPGFLSLDIHFRLYVDGLSLLFALLISGIGHLFLYSIYYLSDRKEELNKF